VHVARLEDDDGRLPGPQGRRQRLRIDPPLVVGSHRLGPAQAEVAQRVVDALVALRPGDDPDPRRSGEAVAGGVPPGLREHPVARGQQAGEVRRRGTGREADRGVDGEAEEVEQPGRRHLLDRGHGRRHRPQAVVLVPRTDQPVGGERRRLGAADDHAVEPARRHGRQSGLAGAGQQVDDVAGVARPGGQVAAQGVGDLVGRACCGHGPLAEGLEPVGRVVVRPLQRVGAWVHGWSPASSGRPTA